MRKQVADEHVITDKKEVENIATCIKDKSAEKETSIIQMGKLLTITEVVNILQVNHNAVYDYIERGVLKAHRLGAKGKKSKFNRYPWRVWESDLLAFINSGESGKSTSSK